MESVVSKQGHEKGDIIAGYVLDPVSPFCEEREIIARPCLSQISF